MTAEIVQFIPKANPRADRAFWIGEGKPLDGTLELYHADGSTFGAPVIAGRIVDTAPPDYVAPDGDCA